MTLLDIIKGRLDAGRHIADSDIRMLVAQAEEMAQALEMIAYGEWRFPGDAESDMSELAKEALKRVEESK